MNFSKAFLVNHQLLANNLKSLLLNLHIINSWLSFLQDQKQRAVLGSISCTWKTVNKGMMQGSV